MMTKLFVGNLADELTVDELLMAFASYGEVSSARIVTEGPGGRTRGFGFIEMPSQTNAVAAIKGLNRFVLKGRTLNVSRAHQQQSRSNRGNQSRGWSVVSDGEHRW
jgi:RNA recognition motif-containing protein